LASVRGKTGATSLPKLFVNSPARTAELRTAFDPVEVRLTQCISFLRAELPVGATVHLELSFRLSGRAGHYLASDVELEKSDRVLSGATVQCLKEGLAETPLSLSASLLLPSAERLSYPFCFNRKKGEDP
jgi:hypothetical protein